jgi:GNAT superfamily N-acetyltransferase
MTDSHDEIALRIRKVEVRDVEAVRAVLITTWHDTYDDIFGRERVDEITGAWHSVEALRNEVAREAHAFLLVERGGEIVATGSAGPLGDAIAVHRLYVRPDMQSRGIGAALLEALVARFDARAAVELQVAAANARAIAFYVKCGFVAGELDEDHRVMRRGRVRGM